MNPRKEVIDLQEELKNLRRHFHKNPETAFEEHNTSKFIASYL